MIGTSHEIESCFMDELPKEIRSAVSNVLRNYRLVTLVEMYKGKIPDELKSQFNLDAVQWVILLRAVILTRISCFNINKNYPEVYINKLLELIAYVLNMPNANIDEMHSEVRTEYSFFSKWVENAIEIKKIKQLRHNDRN